MKQDEQHAQALCQPGAPSLKMFHFGLCGGGIGVVIAVSEVYVTGG